MKKFIAQILVCFGLILATLTAANIPTVNADTIPAMTGVIVDSPLACRTEELNSEAKTTLNRWRELNAKQRAGTLTVEENIEGGKLSVHPVGIDPETGELVLEGSCGALPNGLPVTVKLLDGLDYFVLTGDGQTFILKAPGFKQDAN